MKNKKIKLENINTICEIWMRFVIAISVKKGVI